MRSRLILCGVNWKRQRQVAKEEEEEEEPKYSCLQRGCAHSHTHTPTHSHTCEFANSWAGVFMKATARMDSMQKETDTELKVECPLPNVGPLPIPGQLTGSLPFPVSPAPIPPPDGELCIHRRVWANLEREPSHLPAEPSSYDLVD